MQILRRISRVFGKILRGHSLLVIQQPESVWEKQFKKGNWDFMLDTHKRIPARHIATHIEALPKPLTLLDVGCGNGALALELHTQHDVQYVGMDISNTALSKARELHPEGIFIHTDASNPPHSKQFDVVVFSEILYYLDTNVILPLYKKLIGHDGMIIISMYASWRNYVLWLLIRRHVTIQTIQKVSSPDRRQSWHIAYCTYPATAKGLDTQEQYS